jgi:hypothetical protein
MIRGELGLSMRMDDGTSAQFQMSSLRFDAAAGAMTSGLKWSLLHGETEIVSGEFGVWKCKQSSPGRCPLDFVCKRLNCRHISH